MLGATLIKNMFDYKSRETVFFSLQETHIACRPTHPDVKMTFFKEETEISDKLQSFLFKYDPKIGLIIVEGRISYHSGKVGNIYCSLCLKYAQSWSKLRVCGGTGFFQFSLK